MTKYRFKTEEEFRKDGLWNCDYGTPNGWNSDGEMCKFLGKTLSSHYKGVGKYSGETKASKDCGNWHFQESDILPYIEGKIEEGDTVRCIVGGNKGNGYSLGLEYIATTIILDIVFDGVNLDGVFHNSLELVKKGIKEKGEPEYKARPIPDDAIKLRVIKKPHWQEEKREVRYIPTSLVVGSITWMSLVNEGNTCYHIEDNRYYVNFDTSCFEIVLDDIVMTPGYTPIENYTQIIELLESDRHYSDFHKGDIIYATSSYFIDKGFDERILDEWGYKVLKIIGKRDIPNPVKEETKVKEEDYVSKSNKVQHVIREDSGYEGQGGVVVQSRRSRTTVVNGHLKHEAVVVKSKSKVIIG